ncbi:MAG: DUF2914 domain-containing protein [bacterium]|jgi:hypothetical protein
MRVAFVFFVPVLAAFILAGACAGSEEGVKVAEIELCAAVRDRTPVGAAESFPSDIAQVYCFTRIVGAQDTTSVQHVWYYGEREMGRVDLSVRSASWRTWSTKRMAPDWKGTWRVEVVHGDTTVIASKEFILE